MTPWSLKQALQISKIKKSDNYVQLGLLEISNVRCMTTNNLSLILSLRVSKYFVAYLRCLLCLKGFPGATVVKNPPTNPGDAGFIPESGRCPGVGNGNPLQYPCLENPMDRGAWWAIVHGVAKELDMTELELERLCSEKIHRAECYGI